LDQAFAAGAASLVTLFSVEATAGVSAAFVLVSLVGVLSELPATALLLPRLSVIYQPEPLKTIPAGWMTRRTLPSWPQGHAVRGSSLKLWNFSNCLPQVSQAYTYVGIARNNLLEALIILFLKHYFTPTPQRAQYEQC
jgi:hypothetical protein